MAPVNHKSGEWYTLAGITLFSVRDKEEVFGLFVYKIMYKTERTAKSPAANHKTTFPDKLLEIARLMIAGPENAPNP
ncbi:MAG: hypothetical protein ACD_34C00307G0001 [uncultured bacterium]|nr:MAG: hypothetical protein ACD_34C00307G0001 [uncultured bacterium]